MNTPGAKTYRPWNPHRYAQESAHCPAAKLPEGDLVFFLLDTVPQLDLSRFYAYSRSRNPRRPAVRPGGDGLPAAVQLLRRRLFQP